MHRIVQMMYSGGFAIPTSGIGRGFDLAFPCKMSARDSTSSPGNQSNVSPETRRSYC